MSRRAASTAFGHPSRSLASPKPVEPFVLEAMEEARSGMVTQLASFTHNTTEFLRREEQLLLHGRGAPKVGTKMADRSVAVCVAGPELVDMSRSERVRYGRHVVGFVRQQTNAGLFRHLLADHSRYSIALARTWERVQAAR